MLTHLRMADEVLHRYAAPIGDDLPGYRHHVYRVTNLCARLADPGSDDLETITAAAVFHDLAIWTHGTFDYLAPSVELARDYLAQSGRARCRDTVAAMILNHHRIRRYRGRDAPLVEAFRRADWIDVSYAVVHPGLPRGWVRGLFDRWPSAGFHRRLVTLSLTRLRTHPLSPLPMLRF